MGEAKFAEEILIDAEIEVVTVRHPGALKKKA
jgi:hypothetical protein